jgi:predicted transcriptional regulator
MKKFDPKDFVAAFHGVKDYSVPKSWFTIEQIRQELNLGYTRNASSRAFELHKRGLLERQAHQSKAKTGQCHRAYIYRPIKPYRTVKEAMDNAFKAKEDKVPKGWVRVMEYAVDARVSHVTIRARVERANPPKRYFKTMRGIAGLHLNAFYRKADLDRLLRKRP